MIEALLVLFCLIVVFFIRHKKIRFLAMFQAVLTVFISALVLFFLPQSPFKHFASRWMGQDDFLYFQAVLIKTTFLNIPIINIIEYSILILLVFSVIEFADFVKELLNLTEEKQFKVEDKVFFINDSIHRFVLKIYLLFCRLLN